MTQDNLLIITACIQKQLCMGNSLYVAFIDFKKAFNFVNHTILFYKLIKAGISGRVLNLLRNMYSKIKAIVKVKNRLYKWIKDHCGTNQGGPLSPNMFRFILADLREYLKSESGIVIDDEVLVHLLWADDLVLMSDSAEGLQSQLDCLFKFCCKSQMIVNETKTKIMTFGKNSSVHTFSFNNKQLEIVTQYKYLGVIFNTCRNMKGNIFKSMGSYISDKARKATFATIKKCKSVGFLTPKVALQLFDSNVASILNYASEIWYNGNPIDDIERVQLRFLKYLLGVKDSTCTQAVYGELGRFPVYLTAVVSIIKYWIRILNYKDNSLLRKAFTTIKHLDDAGYRTWASLVRGILEKYNFAEVWDNPQPFIQNGGQNFILQLKEQVFGKFINDWSCQILNYPKLRSYILYKKDFCFETYLLEIKDFKLRKIIAKLRLSSHDLRIEKGRYEHRKVEDRLCEKCCSGDIEDEHHVLLKCPMYNAHRLKFKEQVSRIDSNHKTDFISIMGSTNKDILFCLGKFVQKLFVTRNN